MNLNHLPRRTAPNIALLIVELVLVAVSIVACFAMGLPWLAAVIGVVVITGSIILRPDHRADSRDSGSDYARR